MSAPARAQRIKCPMAAAACALSCNRIEQHALRQQLPGHVVPTHQQSAADRPHWLWGPAHCSYLHLPAEADHEALPRMCPLCSILACFPPGSPSPITAPPHQSLPAPARVPQQVTTVLHITIAAVHSWLRTLTQAMQVEAERILLKAALQREGNQRFVLLSEHCLPLYPPGALYAQLVLENLSRLHACASATPEDISRRVLWRWVPCSHPLAPRTVLLRITMQLSRSPGPPD